MAYEVDIQNESGYPVEAVMLQKAAITTLTAQSAPEASTLTVVLTDNDTVAAMNQQYRGIAAATDVLSFPAEMPPAEFMDDEPPYLGDLVIAFPYAAAQADSEGHPLQESIMLLVVHGTLHLLGYDHDTPENRAAMWAAQDAALTQLGISTAIVPALESKTHDTEAE